MKRIFALLLCGVMLASLLAGCDTQSDTPYVPTGDGLTWDEDYTGPTPGRSETDDTQVLNLTYYPDKGMNPYDSIDFTNRTLYSLLYQSLFIVDRDYNVEPLLCGRYFRSDDMKTYVFYLAENITFSDGTPMTTTDVEASLEAAEDSDMYSGRFLHVSGIYLTEDGGVAIQTDIPCENLPLLLDIPIVKASQVEEEYPLGTGPYMLDTTTGTLRLRRRDDWWCRAELLVTAPSIALIPAESPTHIRDQFEFADLSLVCADPGSDRYVDYRCDYELWDCENGIFVYLACNMDSEVFSDPTLRAALTYAIDRDSLAEKEYRGFARSATLPASPLSPYYSQALAEQYRYDSAKFAQAVNDTGKKYYGVTLLVNSGDSLRVRVAKEIAQMLTDCGLVVQLSELSGNDYMNALRYRNYDLYLGQTKLSANMDLTAFFTATGALSYGKINDVAIQTLCRESLANHGNYYTLHKTIMDDGRLCPVLFRSYAVYATRGLLTGLTPSRDNVFYYSLGRTMDGALIKE